MDIDTIYTFILVFVGMIIFAGCFIEEFKQGRDVAAICYAIVSIALAVMAIGVTVFAIWNGAI
jgi:biotin transporter BioY